MAPTWIRQRLQVFNDPRLRFLPEPHEYYLGERKLTNFSSWIEQYTEPFNAELQAPITAARRGCSTQQVRDEWDLGQWVGTKTHAYIEGHYRTPAGGTCPDPEPHEDVQLRCQKFHQLREQRLLNYVPIGVELQVFDEASGLCGTIDFPAQHVPTEGIWVIDWKTNASISTAADPVYRYMKGPFSDLVEHKHNIISLQTSFYRVILENAGIPTAGGAIAHLPPGHRKPYILPAIDYRARIRAVAF